MQHVSIYIVNVYWACSINKKRALWKELVKAKSKFPQGEWIVVRYFNSTLKKNERKGDSSSINISELFEFGEFIGILILIGAPTLDR